MEPDGLPVGVDDHGRDGLPVVKGEDGERAAQVRMTPVPFGEFYRLSRDRVVRGLALTLGDADLAADATDEALARAYQRWGQVGALDDPAAWVYRVGLNWASSVLRRRRRAPSPPAERSLDDVAPFGEPSVMAALAELPEGQRSAIVCRYYLGMSETETAVALNTRPGTVKSRLHRGLQELRIRLAHLRPEEQQ